MILVVFCLTRSQLPALKNFLIHAAGTNDGLSIFYACLS
jgi:hypothetical protein